MRHYHPLLVHRDPVCDIEFVGLWIVQPGDLLRQEVDQEGIKIKVLWNQPKTSGLRAEA